MRLILLFRLFLLASPAAAAISSRTNTLYSFEARIYVHTADGKGNASEPEVFYPGVYAVGGSVESLLEPVTIFWARPADGCTNITRPENATDPFLLLLTTGQCTVGEQMAMARLGGAKAALISSGTSDMLFMEGIPRGYLAVSISQDTMMAISKMDLSGSVSVTLSRHAQVVSQVGMEMNVTLFLQYFFSVLVVIGTVFGLSYAFSSLVQRRTQRNYTDALQKRKETLRKNRARALEKIEVQGYKKPGADDDPTKGGIYCSGCAVCLDDFQDGDIVRVLRCQHVYHVDCIDEWLLSKGTCPYCKMDFITGKYPEDSRSSTHFHAIPFGDFSLLRGNPSGLIGQQNLHSSPATNRNEVGESAAVAGDNVTIAMELPETSMRVPMAEAGGDGRDIGDTLELTEGNPIGDPHGSPCMIGEGSSAGEMDVTDAVVDMTPVGGSESANGRDKKYPKPGGGSPYKEGGGDV